jgi:hypothetical protein
MPLRCPSCNADNADDARKCSACGTRLGRRPRRRPTDDETNLGESGPLVNRATRRALRCAVCGLIPLVGLFLGPVALVLGILAYRTEKAGPPIKGRSPALGVVTLALFILVTNWAGLLLMIYGWTSAAAR